MALEPDQMAWDIFLIVIQGVILALVLNKWNDYTVQRREERRTKELVIKVHKLLSEKDALNLYYLLKLLSSEDLSRVQMVLLMDFYKTHQSDNSGDRDVLTLQNKQFRLRLDPNFESRLNMKGTWGDEFFVFGKPERGEFLNSFLEFVRIKCAESGIKL